MPLSIGTVASHNNYDPSELTIVYNSNGTINSSIRGDIPNNWRNSWTISGYVVVGTSATRIGNNSFRYNFLTSATIPDSVTTIGSWAFQNNRLSSVTIGNSVTSIGDYAFYQNRLTAVTITDSVTSIGQDAFRINQLTSAITIPSSVTSIRTRAFRDNPNLSTVNCYTTQTAFVGANAFQSTASPLTLRVRATDGTWTAGTQSFQGNGNVNVVKNL